ncbi:MAG: hypothetical protein HYR91_12730 [Flavobacteriia bacterium]|nr:hypothetical protein [Flavobacteriia bacterium]
MLKVLFVVILIVSFFSCQHEKEENCGLCGLNMNRIDAPATPEEAIQMTKEQDNSTIGSAEFQENKAKIVKKYGEQWGFCECVILNDSIDKQIKAGNLDSKLEERLQVVEKHCKAFLIMDNNITPEQREIHEKKVKKCLQSSGIK